MRGVYKYKSKPAGYSHKHAGAGSQHSGPGINDSSAASAAIRRGFGLSGEDVITVDTLRDMLMVKGLFGGMNAAIGSLILEEGLWLEAMELAMSDNDQTAFRASWALEWAYVADMEKFVEFVPHFFGDYLRARNESVNRVYSKMLCDMLRRGVIVLSDRQASASTENTSFLSNIDSTPPTEKTSVQPEEHATAVTGEKFTLSYEQMSAVAEKAFDLLLDPDMAVAVKVWQIELLYDLSESLDWIEEQLTAIVRAMSEHPDCTPAEAAHARHYFKKLAKRQRAI